MLQPIASMDVSDLGELEISPHVLELIAKYSILEIDGVKDLDGGFTNEITDFFNKGNGTNGVKVILDENNVKVDAYVIIKYGNVIQNLALNIQENIKSSLENMTGLNVSEINIYISGIEIDTNE